MANIKARVGNQNVVKVLSNAPAGIQRLINLKDVDDTLKTRDGCLVVWNLPNKQFIMTSVIDNTIHISDETESINSATGALTVAGGVGIGSNLEVGGNIKAIGIVTFGSGTVTIDGDNDLIQVGSGVTLDGNTGVFTPAIEINGPLTADTLNIAGVSTLARDGGITTTGGDLFVGQNLQVAGVSTFIGNATFKGGTIGIGDSSDDDINVQGEFISSLVPNATDSYDIGSETQRWRNAWFSGSGSFTNLLTVGNISTPGISTAETFSGYTNLQAIHSDSTKEFDVVVGTKTADHRYGAGGNGYIIDGLQSPALTLNAGTTYRFNLSAGDQTSHPFRFYLDAARTIAYTTNVTVDATYTEIEITDETPLVLHYQCSLHPLMGNQIQVVSNKLDTPYVSNLRNGVDVSGISTFGGKVNITTNLEVSGISTLNDVVLVGDDHSASWSKSDSHLKLDDDTKVVFGSESDLQIFHAVDSTGLPFVNQSYIAVPNNSGDLNIVPADTGTVRVTGYAENSILAQFNSGSSVQLYNDGDLKLETTGTGVSISSGAALTATLAAPANFIIDPAAVGDDTGVVRIKGDLYVDGTQFQVNSTTVNIADKVIGIATTCTDDNLLDEAGIGIGTDGNRKTILYDVTNTALKSSENFNLASEKEYLIAGNSVLSATTLGAGVTSSSLTSVGNLIELTVDGTLEAGLIDGGSY